MGKDFGPLVEGAMRGHDDRSLLIAQRKDLEEQIGALQAPLAQRSSRVPPSFPRRLQLRAGVAGHTHEAITY